MNKINKIGILLLCLTLASCSLFQEKPIENTIIEEKIETFKPPAPSSIQAREVVVTVITPEQCLKWIGMEGQVVDFPEEFVYYGFNEADYLDMSQFLADVIRYLKEQKTIIEYYEKQ